MIDDEARRRRTRPLLDEATTPRRHWLETADHVRLHLLELPRPGEDAVLLLPGFHRRAETPTHLSMAQRLAGRAATYSLDFRGHGRSEGRYAFGIREEEDVLAALRFLRAAGRKRIFVVGLSMGGYVATKTLGARPREFPEVAAMTVISAPARWIDVYPRLDLRVPLMARTPRRERARRPRISFRAVLGPRREAADVVGDLGFGFQVHHHRKDWLIRFEHGEELYRLAKEPREFLEYGGDGRIDHADALVCHRFQEIMGSIEAFFVRFGFPEARRALR